MKRIVVCAALTVFLCGCSVYRGGKVVDGTNLEVGMMVPGTSWSIDFLSYTGGMKVAGNDATAITVTNVVAETNSYFGVVTIRRHTRMTATIEPTESADEVGGRNGHP